jgi:hypothetical protein
VDFRLLIVNYSVMVLVPESVVDEGQRGREQVEKLLTEETVLRESDKHFRTLANSAPVMICMSDGTSFAGSSTSRGWILWAV